ncbi:MAG: hypothetical protein KDC54_18345 [Lewinella sp.]|nr:hypothetical protein [Lewinella sp.]
MLKLLITGFLIYFVYRYFIAPPALNNSSRHDPIDGDQQWSNTSDDKDDGDYIDYEEVD